MKALVGELSAKANRPRGSVEQLLGDHFAACMDEPAIEAAGLTPLAPLLAEITGTRDRVGIERPIRRLHEMAIKEAVAQAKYLRSNTRRRRVRGVLMATKRKVNNLLALAALATVIERPMHRYEIAEDS